MASAIQTSQDTKPLPEAERIAALAAENTVNFNRWKCSPGGLSAMGFKRATKPCLDNPALTGVAVKDQ